MSFKRRRITLSGIASLLIAFNLAACQAEATPTPAPTFTPTAMPTQSMTAEPTAGAATGEPALELRWERLETLPPAPVARKYFAFAYGETDEALLMHGGQAEEGDIVFDQLWSFEDGDWVEIVVPEGPGGRWGHSAVFDGQSSQLVLFGGMAEDGFSAETWTFDLQSRQWNQIQAGANAPEARYGFCSGYDQQNGIFYVSHGFGASGGLDDTWAYNLSDENWSRVAAGNEGPSARGFSQCAFDAASGALILFGGLPEEGESPLGDLWRLDTAGESWEELSVEARPSPRHSGTLVYDNQGRQALLFGGATAQGVSGELWSLREGNWQRLAGAQGAAPLGRSGHGVAFVQAASSMFIVLGAGEEGLLADLWRVRLE